jgi:hypothetical protein
MVTRIKDKKISQSIYTWFEWNTCHKCFKEFRREHGYKSFIVPKSNNNIRNVYLCETCGISKEHADIYFMQKRKEFRESRPPRKI